MLIRETPVFIDGPVGQLEALYLDVADARGIVLLCHPNPVQGGTMTNKVVSMLQRTARDAGYVTLRFNYRGVGASAGSHDEGRGETDDFLDVVTHTAPEGTLALAGFSFGSFVASHALAELQTHRQVEKVAFVGTAAQRFTVAPIASELKPLTAVILA